LTALKARAALPGGPEEALDDQHHTPPSAPVQEIKAVSRKLAVRRSEWMCKAIASDSLTDGEKLTLVRLGLYFDPKKSNRAWPSHERLAEDCAVSDRTIRRRLDRAQTLGFIYIDRRNGGVFNDCGTMRGLTNIYYLALPPGVSLDPRKADDDDEGGAGPNLDAGVQVHESQIESSEGETRTNGAETWTDGAPNLDTRCPTKTPVGNTPEEASRIKSPPQPSSFLDSSDKPVSSPTDHQTFPVVSEPEAEAFVIRLFGNGDDALGRKVSLAIWPGWFAEIKKWAVAGRLRPQVIHAAIEDYRFRTREGSE
jgi:hypothetical protein